MSIFPIPDELLPDAKKLEQLEQMNKEFAALMPKQFAAAVNMMAHPVAGIAAFSALGLGVASQAFGVWMGAVAGITEASQRLFSPLLDEVTPNDFQDKAKTPATRACEVADSLIADARRTAVEAPKKAADTTKAAEVKSAKQVEDAKLASGKMAARAAPSLPVPEPAAKVAKTPVVAKSDETQAKPVEAVAELMPEDFRQPKAMEKPKAPDDLKLISGIGPKLEKVLNGLGIWTYAQIAAWGREQVAWVDDYLAFKGRIGRDGWIEQAAKLAKLETKH
jgi:NADH-quinone oxidoreductase subunit E